ncbi:hypothetical protein Bbelb_218750 [Branchiostoma belcheri]|nr:hypothetical protein Bbelb_218750 [Branchiostoma belcheri]
MEQQDKPPARNTDNTSTQQFQEGYSTTVADSPNTTNPVYGSKDETTPAQQSETDYSGLADAVANTPNPTYDSIDDANYEDTDNEADGDGLGSSSQAKRGPWDHLGLQEVQEEQDPSGRLGLLDHQDRQESKDPWGHQGLPGLQEKRDLLGHPACWNTGTNAYCPKGYNEWRGICYEAIDARAKFHESARRCRLAGGTLAMPRDAATDAFLIFLKNTVNDDSSFWFGLHDRHKEGSFEWIDGSALETYTHWATEQPDSEHYMEDCVQYYRSSTDNRGWKDKWNDANCFEQHSYICQVVPGTY